MCGSSRLQLRGPSHLRTNALRGARVRVKTPAYCCLFSLQVFDSSYAIGHAGYDLRPFDSKNYLIGATVRLCFKGPLSLSALVAYGTLSSDVVAHRLLKSFFRMRAGAPLQSNGR